LSTAKSKPPQVDTIRRYAEAMGGTLRLEVQVGDDIFQLA
jgi:hypothetical protein